MCSTASLLLLLVGPRPPGAGLWRVTNTVRTIAISSTLGPTMLVKRGMCITVSLLPIRGNMLVMQPMSNMLARLVPWT